MLFVPTIGAQLSGSIGGITASHNAGGTYFRQRAVPTNPATPFQVIPRQLMGELASRWTNTLTQLQRDAWILYASNVTILNRIGVSINVSGLNMYQRSNIPRLQAGLPRVDSGPTTFNLGEFTAPTIASLTAPTALSLNFDITDDWVGEDDAAMLIYGSRAKGPAIVFFKGPYRALATQLLGDLAIPPTSPFAGVMPFVQSAPNKGFIRVQVTRVDGRLSEDLRLEAIAV